MQHHIGGDYYAIQEIKNQLQQKVDKHEIHSTNSDVASLERSVRELSSEVTGLRYQLQEQAERIAELEQYSHVPVTFIEDENGFLKVDKEQANETETLTSSKIN